MPPSVVLITNDSFHGQGLLEALHRRGIVPDAVLVLTGGFGPPARRGLSPLRRLLAWPRSAASALRRKARFYRGRMAFYRARCRRVVVTGDMNSGQMVRDLERLAPDFALWGGGGILQPRTIEAARRGVLNVHPALLPWVRGCGIIGHSLTAGVPVGATLHYIDRMIDTGPLIQRRLLPVPAGMTSLGEIEGAAYRLAWEMMAELVEGITARGEVPGGVVQPVRYPLFRWADEEGRKAQEALAAAGRAAELFRLWSAYCDDRERWTLPDTFFGAAPTLTLEPVSPEPSPVRKRP